MVCKDIQTKGPIAGASVIDLTSGTVHKTDSHGAAHISPPTDSPIDLQYMCVADLYKPAAPVKHRVPPAGGGIDLPDFHLEVAR